MNWTEYSLRLLLFAAQTRTNTDSKGGSERDSHENAPPHSAAHATVHGPVALLRDHSTVQACAPSRLYQLNDTDSL